MVYTTVSVDVDLGEFDDDELKEELEDRGYITLDKEDGIDPEALKDQVFRLRQAYYTLSPEQFKKQLLTFFREQLDTIDY
jgi:hypothetical protein